MADRVGAAHALCDCGWRLMDENAADGYQAVTDHADANPGHHITLVYSNATEHVMTIPT
ncbi:MAG: hypothetical protein GY906_10255 [bacterium]|nr:hypothetical protein [bacterium]